MDFLAGFPAGNWVRVVIGMVLTGVLTVGCGHSPAVRVDSHRVAYVPEDASGGLLARFAPVFVTYHQESPHNHTGRPVAV